MESRNERWRQISRLFDAALERPREERASWLAESCAGDPELRGELERMISAHERVGLLDRAPASFTTTTEISSRVGLKIGHYRLVEEIGRGGMGVVFKAYDERLERYVALKFMSRDLRGASDGHERLLFEARAASALDHPNICTIYDIGETPDGDVFIAMAYCEGQTLAARLAAGPLPVEECIMIARQVAEGLACAHDAGIVHRDIKPSNIVIGARGTVRIVDFGIAQFAASPAAQGRAGTLLYSAPEQLTGSDTDRRADIWSLGVVLHEMITGRRPFAGSSNAEIMDAVLHRDPEPASALRAGVPPSVADAIRKALAKSSADRFANAAEFVAALEPNARKPAPRNLPVSMTSFVGRETDVQRALALLRSARLVTFTGPAGTGKTRLAIEVARSLQREFRDGVAFVPLSAVRDIELVLPAIAEALNISTSGVRPVREDLSAATEGCEMLLVLDNFEQVVSAAPLIAGLLNASDGLKVAVTSRVPLKLTGEHEMPVPALQVPTQTTGNAAARTPAVRLFIDRARAVRPDLPLDDGTIGAIAEICTRLDGLPLAIELAAARAKIFSPQAIAARLGSRLDLLKSGDRDRPARHQTLRQALAWSYDLLNDAERRVFRCAGVFAGGFTVEALESLCEHGCGDVLDAVSTLVDHSLFAPGEGPGHEARFMLLETMREYALELLEQHGEGFAAGEAHARWFSGLCDRASSALTGPSQTLWMKRLDADHDNVRAAIVWYEKNGQVADALRIATAIWRFWTARGHHREGRTVFDRLLESATEQVEARLRAHAFNAAGTLAHGCCDMDSARRLLQESLRLFRQNGDVQGVGLVLNNLSWIEIECCEFAAARELADEAYRLHVQIGDKRGIAVALNNLGWIANYLARFDEAHACFEQSIALRRESGDLRGVAFGLTNLGWMEQRRGSYERSAHLIDEAMALLRELDDPLLLSWARQQRGAVAYLTGHFADAASWIEQALPAWRSIGNTSGLAFGGYYYALSLLQLGDAERALSVLIESETAMQSMKQRWGIAILALARTRLSLARGDSADALGRCLFAIGILHKIGDRVMLAEAYDLCGGIVSSDLPDHAGTCRERARSIRLDLCSTGATSTGSVL